LGELDRTRDAGGVVDPGLTPRLRARIRQDFAADTERAVALLESAVSDNQDRERVLAAIVFAAHGDLQRLHDAVELSHVDWRDVLVGGGLGNVDWRQRMDAELGAQPASDG